MDDCSCWFFHSNQSFINWTLFWFIFSFIFSFVIDNCSYGSLLRKSLKVKNFLLLTIDFCFLHKCFWGNFASAIICPCTLKKIQISIGKSLGHCRMLRWISKAAFTIETGHLELLTPETMKLLGCTKSKITKNKVKMCLI